ncbi:MAG: flippase-like domain-containing protein [Alphaproteobacteria bacterium]|nr:flippase-like domain-containing protein [Alphaproteobacteria bacterium]
MKAAPVLAALIGLAAGAALVGYFGAGAVLHSLSAVGWAGFAAICAIHLAMMALMGLAWRALVPGGGAGIFIWGRLVRDAGSEVLPLSQVGGYVLGARALALAGIGGTVAAASTIVDVTLEFLGQIAYTGLGLGWLVRLRPDADLALPVLLGLGVAGTAAIGFVAVQRRGFDVLERFARHLGRGWVDRTAASAAALHLSLADIYRHPAGLWTSFALHLACWIASAAETWLALRFADKPVGFGAALVVESLLYAIRTAAFAIPNAVGVQEGAYILVGSLFGLSPEMGLALSLLKRARDLAIGLPTLAVWQGIEAGRLWHGRRPRSSAAAVPAPLPSEIDR